MGPLYRSMQAAGQKLELYFDYAEGLQGRDGASLIGFEVAGSDGIWHPAQAMIADHHVVVWSDQVSHPLQARYGWQPYTEANLVNGAGLPASTFMTEKLAASLMDSY